MDPYNDILRGGIGNDSLYLGSGSDTAYGDGGNDVFDDMMCTASKMYGVGGNDTFYSQRSVVTGDLCSSAKDTIFGATGTDTAHANKSDYVTGVEKLSRL